MTRYFRWIIALGLLSQMGLSWPLWLFRAEGAMPALPIWGIAYMPDGLWNIFGCLPLVAGCWVLFSGKKPAVIALIATLGLAVITDLNRLQPWVYWYVLVFGVLAFAKHPKPMLAWMLAAMYLWGGLHKLSPWFAEDNFPWFCEAFALTEPLGNATLGYSAAVVEALLAPLLLLTRTRRIGLAAATALHLWIVLVLSPVGLDWNTVVIPWNIAILASIWYIFNTKDIFLNKYKPAEWVFIGWMLLSPVLPFMPRAMGWYLYTNTQPEATFIRGADVPACVADWEDLAYDEGKYLQMADWSTHSLGVPLNTSDYILYQLRVYLCDCTKNGGMEVLKVRWWSKEGESMNVVPCSGSND